MAEEMREQMVRTVTDVMASDARLTVLLGNISAKQFAPAFQRFPARIHDLGIMEQTMMSVGAGLALEGLIPVIHSIAPFLVERSFEQIKDDFVYQRLGGNFISIGASYDYGTEGMTHHAPGDVQILRSLPGMQVLVPGTAAEFDRLFRETYANDAPTYFRLAAQSNDANHAVHFGRAEVVRQGDLGTIVAIGPMLSRVLAAVEGLDICVLYYTTVAPFDAATLRAHGARGPIVLVEPFYAGTLLPAVVEALAPDAVRAVAIGVPRQVLTHYGTLAEHDAAYGLTAPALRERIAQLVSGHDR